MGNCLVTRLKDVVENDNLIPLGGIEVLVNSETAINNQYIRSVDNSSVSITVIGEGTITVSGVSYGNGQTFVVPNLARAVNFSAGKYKVLIKNKYALRDFRFGLSHVKNINSLAYCNEIEQLAISQGMEVVGDIKAFEGMTKLTSLILDRVYGYKGNIKSLGKLVNLKTLSLIKMTGDTITSVSGDLLDLVNEQITNGRTSVTSDSPLGCNGILEHVTFNGNSYQGVSSMKLTWESLNGVATKVIGYNGSSVSSANRIFAYGASSEEISSWESEGKTVVRVD